jgi:hypothetical protein
MLVSETGARAPERSLSQRRAALARANEIRCYRAQLKRDLMAGRVRFWDVMQDPDSRVESMRVADLLAACPGWGPVKVGVVFRHAAISPSKTVTGLTPRQFRALSLTTCQFPRAAGWL